MVGSLFVSSSEVQNYLEQAFQELYGIACAEWEDLLVSVQDTFLTAGQSSLNFGGLSAMKKLRGIRIKSDNFLVPVSLREVQNMDRDARTGRPVAYWLYGDQVNSTGFLTIEVLPAADTAYTLTLYYQPALQMVDITAGAMPMLAGWDEYLVVTAAIKCKDKEESSVSVLMTEKQMLLANLRSSWTPVNVSEAQRVVPLLSGSTRNIRAYDYRGPDDDY